ncbi:MAG: hypothetical protein AB7G11_09725 [Phycisphaerales bacterium]
MASAPGSPSSDAPSDHPVDRVQPAAGSSSSDSPAPPSTTLGRQLFGDLPCFVCKYNLKGVSIRSACPECGTAVRATILAMVDPLARELRPIHRPGLVAAALAAWGFFAFVAACISWLAYVPGLAGLDWRIPLLVAGGLSGVGALCFVRPHDAIPARGTVFAALGVLAYVPLLYLAGQLAGPRWIFSEMHYPPASIEPDSNRLVLRLVFDATLGAMLALLRPNARLLVARSLAMRTGRVDRQTIRAMILTVGVTAIGDALQLLAPHFLGVVGDTIEMIGVVLVVAGSLLLTIGALGLMVDSIRIARTIVAGTPDLAAIIHGPRAPAPPE